MLAQKGISREALPVDGAIEVSPSPPTLIWGSSWARCVRDIDPARGHQLYRVTVAKAVGDVPADAENDGCAVGAAAAEEGGRERAHAADYRLPFALAPQPSIRSYLTTATNLKPKDFL